MEMTYNNWLERQETAKQKDCIWNLLTLGLLEQATFCSAEVYASFNVNVLSEIDKLILPSISYSINLTTFRGRQERYYYDYKEQRVYLMGWSEI